MQDYLKIHVNFFSILIIYVWEVFFITRWPVVAQNIFFSSTNYIFALSLLGITSSMCYVICAFTTRRDIIPYFSILSMYLRVCLLSPVYVRSEFYTFIFVIMSCYALGLYCIKSDKCVYTSSLRIVSNLAAVSNVIFFVIMLVERKILYALPSFIFYFSFPKTHITNVFFHNMIILTAYITH